MPSERVDFGPRQKSGHDEVGGAAPFAMNVCVDGSGVVRRRPGIQAYGGAPATVVDAAGVLGLHETLGGDLYAVGGDPATKRVYFVTAASATDISASSAVYLVGGLRPIIAETEAMIVLAGGNQPLKVEFAVLQTALLGGSPPLGSHVIANSSRLLMNDVITNLGRVSYSATAAGSSIAGHEDWSSIEAGFFTAEARPDPVLALHENTSEVFPFGSTSLQYHAPDAQSVYAPVSTREHGLAAPYSVIKSDQAFAWLDHQRRFVVSDGRSLQVLSRDIQQTLNDMTTVGDCFGYRVHDGPLECFVWTFPTDGRTFAYQVGGGWAQWAERAGANWAQFSVTAHHQCGSNAQNVVGTAAGRICRLQNGVADDLGQPIVASVRTGFLSRESSLRKRCNALRFEARYDGSAPATGLLRWRDDLGGFSDSIVVYFDRPVIELRTLGVYRTRQWEFEFSGTTDFSLVSVTEDFDVLSN